MPVCFAQLQTDKIGVGLHVMIIKRNVTTSHNARLLAPVTSDASKLQTSSRGCRWRVVEGDQRFWSRTSAVLRSNSAIFSITSVGCAWRRRRIHHPWWGCWLGRLLLQLCKGDCWWPWHAQWDKFCSSRYNDDGWRWCFFWKHMYDCTLVTMKIRLKATLNRRVNSHHCMLIDECMHLSLKGHTEINLTVQQKFTYAIHHLNERF